MHLDFKLGWLESLSEFSVGGTGFERDPVVETPPSESAKALNQKVA